MKRILTLVLALSLIFTLAMFTSPLAFADGSDAENPADIPTEPEIATGGNPAPAATESSEPAKAAEAPPVFAVEKNPTDETIPAGGKAIFMAYPKGTQVYTVYWTFETDDGETIEAENAPNYFSGLIVELPDKQRIRLRNVPECMSGLKVRAHFAKMNGETIESEVAYLFVEPGAVAYAPAPCTPAPCTTVQAPVSTKSDIVITKHPLDEINLRDGQSSTFFTSYATGYSWISWEFKIGDKGDPFSAEKAISDYKLNLEGIDTEKITIRNISWGINGWYIRAVFHDACGNVKYSNWAFMRLVEGCKPCTPCTPCKPCTPCTPCTPCAPDPYCGTPITPVTPCTPCYPSVVVVPPAETTYTHTVIDSVSTTYYGGCW